MALFGVSTPLVQQFGAGLGAFSTAALLDAGAAARRRPSRQRIEREARLQRSDLPRLLAMAAFGAAVGPVALVWGLQNTSGTTASLMRTLEALFTAVLACSLYRETMDGRVWTAMALRGATATSLLAMAFGECPPSASAALALIAVGAIGHDMRTATTTGTTGTGTTPCPSANTANRIVT